MVFWLWKQKMGIVNLHLARFYFPVDLPKREAYGYHFDQWEILSTNTEDKNEDEVVNYSLSSLLFLTS